MTWTAPRTWVTAEVVTAALMNTHIRDNLLETSAATATTAGDIVYADAANSMGSRVGIGAASTLLVSDGSAPVWRVPAFDKRTDSTTGTNTSYNSLGGAAWYNDSDNVAVTVTTGVNAVVLFGAQLSNNTAGGIVYISVVVSGATTVAAGDARSYFYESGAANDSIRSSMFWQADLTPGSNTFTLQGRVSAGTGTIDNPSLFVLPL